MLSPTPEDLVAAGYVISFTPKVGVWSATHDGRIIACAYHRENVEAVAREHYRKGELMQAIGAPRNSF